jgi:hypothetical protein
MFRAWATGRIDARAHDLAAPALAAALRQIGRGSPGHVRIHRMPDSTRRCYHEPVSSPEASRL